MNRRAFISTSSLAAGCVAARATMLGSVTKSNPPKPMAQKGDGRRPNILLITTDQQWAGAMSCAGNAYLKTPAMDRIAREGVQFELAYSPNPICVPARASYMTGTPSHENGVPTNLNANQVEFTAPCLAKVFQEHGYHTGHVGKWHIPRSIRDVEWSGFDYLSSVRSNGVDFDIPGDCATFLRQKRDQPFFLVASFVNPHDICEWARRHSGTEVALPNGEIGEPPPPEECPPFRANNAVPAGEASAVRDHQRDPGMSHAYPTQHWELDDGRWRQYLWGYYRMTELVDRYIGEVLDTLHECGLEENTVIVFSSDHGDGMGSHRWNQKTIFYDEIARVPFIVSWKGHTIPGGRDRQHLVNLGTDLFPTLFDFAGIEKPEGLSGLSVAPLAKGEKPVVTHPYIVSENTLHSGFGRPTNVQGRMVRSSRYKYIRYSVGEPNEQLFDMELDPQETRDLTLTREADGVLSDHRRMLNDSITKTGDDFQRVEV